MRRSLLLVALAPALLVSTAGAHDIWIEPSRSVVRPYEPFVLSLVLGNHGNAHRDFRPMGRVPEGRQNLSLVMPSGVASDTTGVLVPPDGDAKSTGAWTANVVSGIEGIAIAHSTFDAVMPYAPVRDVKGAKAFVFVGEAGGAKGATGFDRVLGDPLEIVPLTTPFACKGDRMRVRLLFRGAPLAGETVAFVPRGAVASGGFDPRYEVRTDADGVAEMRLGSAGMYLVSAHRHTDESGAGYSGVGYSATVTFRVGR